MLVADSHDDSVLQKNQEILNKVASVSKDDKRPYVMIFNKKLYIQPSEIEYYEDNGFTVIQPK